MGEAVIRGAGTLLNVATVLAGSGVGLLLGHRLSERTRDVVTDALGLLTLLAAGLSTKAVTDAPFTRAAGPGVPVLIVLGALVVGAIIGSLLRIEARIAALGAVVHSRVGRRSAGSASGAQRARFVQGFLTASLVFCVGPLTVLGSIDDGLGRGIDQLALKSTLDGFAAIAFASTFGAGVAASALTVAVVQGGLTLLGALLGNVLTNAQISALTATGGLLLVGIALRLLRVREIPVGDLLPALLLAPLFTWLVVVLR